MSRSARQLIHEDQGGYHIVSRIVGKQFLMGPAEKDYFVSLLHCLSKVYFVNLHAYCVLDNHFHLLVTMRTEDSSTANSRELLDRLNRWRRFHRRPLEQNLNDAKKQVLQERLGSVSRFVQDLKQEYSRWLNKKLKRTGYLWSDRFKGVLISHGKAQLACAAYIELNPVRAKMVDLPEQYPWSSRGLMSLDEKKASNILCPLHELQEQENSFSDYHDFIRMVMEDDMEKSQSFVKDMDFSIRNPTFSQGCVVGDRRLVASFREATGKNEREIPELNGIEGLSVTRVLSKGYGFP
jgi:REP element-mobilizing transposase RayT